MHSKIFIYKLIFNIEISYWTDFIDDQNIGSVLYAHLVFIFTLGTIIKNKKNEFNFNNNITHLRNKYIYWIIYLILIYIILYGITGDTIMDTGSYSNSGNTEKSTLHEYFLLFYISLIYFSSNSYLYKFSQLLILIIYVFKTLVHGGRIEIVEICLIYSLIFYILPGRLKLQHIVLVIFVGLYLSTVISNFRSNPSLLFSNDSIELFDPSNILEIPKKGDLISSTEGDVIQSSIRIAGLINNNQITSNDRIISFLSYLFSPIVPQTSLPKSSNLSTYKQEEYRSGGGGLISTYFYAWLWYFGPFLVAIFLAIITNKFFEFKSKSIFIYGIAILSTFPRWFSYNPIFLIKFCFFSLIFFQLMILVKNKIFIVRRAS